jgi:Spx/MgsR family transcriptional regulator
MLHLLGIKNCNKIRDTRKWLEENKVDYAFIDLKKDPLSREELDELRIKVGLDTLINRKGMKWKQLGLAQQDLSENELFDILLENQTMIKRPVLIKGDAVLVGYDEASFDAFVKE